MDGEEDVIAANRRGLQLAAPVSLAVSALIWWLTLRLAPVPAIGPFELALACSIAAIFLTVVLAVEAVAHGRLFTKAIDPTLGAENRAILVNRNVLQNTVEQTLVFVPGLFGLAAVGGDPRLILAATLNWIVSRWMFWAGYQRASRYRALGISGMIQNMIVLGYAGYQLIERAFGMGAAVCVLAAFALAEGVLTLRAWRERATR